MPLNKRLAVKNTKLKMPGKRKSMKTFKNVAKKPKLESLNVDDFMDNGFDNLSEESDNQSEEEQNEEEEEVKEEEEEDSENSDEEEDDDTKNVGSDQYKQSIKKLKDTDPDFYKFLQENDKKLLNFEASSSDSEDDNDRIHTGPDKLEVASDDSEYEDDEECLSKQKKSGLSLKQIGKWQDELQQPKPLETVIQICKSFKIIAEKIEGDDKGTGMTGSAVFNGMMRICVVELVPAVNRLLRAPILKAESSTFNPASGKMWPRLQSTMKSYVAQLLKVIPAVASSEIIVVLLKHVLQLVPYIAMFPKSSKSYMKKLIDFWAKGDESTRIIALLCIVRLARKVPDDLLEVAFKAMYLAYVRNCKFTSPSTWPMINFMKHSLVEVLALNQTVAYQHAFVYIRQLSIHLRNAIMIKKKDSIKTVYNWQYIHCLYFWSHFLGTLHPSPILQPLVHPLTQIITGVIKLVPSAKYIPLRYHCVRALTSLSRDTDTFIPVIPFLLEVFDIVNFGKKHSRASWKPLDFLCALKLSKSQLEENSFKDAVVDQFYELLMDYLNVVSHLIGFPELVLTTTIQIRTFLKQLKICRYNKQLKQLLDKINENSQFVSDKRKSVALSISDTKAVENWENQLKTEGTPISKYYALYRKMRDKEIATSMSQKEQLDDYDLPTINRKELMAKKKADDKKEFADLFVDDSDSDGVIDFTAKDKKQKKPIVEKIKMEKNESPTISKVASTQPVTKAASQPIKKEQPAAEVKPIKSEDKKLTKQMISKKMKALGLMEDVVEDINLSSSEDEVEDIDVSTSEDDLSS